jgi:hypothetical protein
MSRCPVCRSVRVVLVIGPTRRAFCTHCGSRWIQDGSVQRAVQRPEPPLGGPVPVSGPPGGDRSIATPTLSPALPGQHNADGFRGLANDWVV